MILKIKGLNLKIRLHSGETKCLHMKRLPRLIELGGVLSPWHVGSWVGFILGVKTPPFFGFVAQLLFSSLSCFATHLNRLSTTRSIR